MLWVDKYRPKSFNEVVGNNKQKQVIEDWLQAWKDGIPQKPLLLIGPAGTGKTTIAHIIAQEFTEYIELNASDKRSHDLLMSTIGESASTKSLFGENKKLIIMDEVDGIHGTNDRGGTSALNKIIKNSKQPIVMMANDFYSNKLTTIKKNSQVLKMEKIRAPTINKFLRDVVLKNEGIEVDPDVLMKLSKRSSGDLRSAINTLQALVENGGELTEETLDTTGQKDNTATVIDTVTRVLKSTNVINVKRSLRENNEDPTLVMEYIAENIPREYEDNQEIKDAYEMISKADLYFGRARSSRNYGYWRYASDFMGPGVALSKKKTYKKFTRVTGPMAFTLMGRSRGQRALRDSIAEKMEEKMHVSLQVAYTIFPYFEIMFEDDVTAWEISDFLELEEDEIKRFRKKKIPKKVITAMEKVKAELREEEKEEWRKSIQKGIFSNIPNQEYLSNESIDNELIDDDYIEEMTIKEDLNNISDDELDEIASEFSLKPSKSRLDKAKTEEEDKKEKKEDNEEKLEKGQTTLFSF
ncbi:MAG: replication factor C large subunit [Methanobrevibacter sp.]|nr:replication factor C large subunit [Methanobrevibacter sp.]